MKRDIILLMILAIIVIIAGLLNTYVSTSTGTLFLLITFVIILIRRKSL